MAAEASLESVALRIARGIHDFAKSRKWKASDYRIFMIFNSAFSRLQVTVFAKAFHDRSPEQEMNDYDDVSDSIESSLGEDRKYFNYVGLILTDDEEHARERATPRTSAEFEIDESLLNQPEESTNPTARQSH